MPRGYRRKWKPLFAVHGPRLLGACAALGLLASAMATARTRNPPEKSAPRPLTVKDSIETARVVNDYGSDPILISPRGDRYVLVLERGDLKRNGSWVELFAGRTTSLEAASRIERVARLFTKSTASDLIKNVQWLSDDEHVTFLWDPGGDLPQVFEADVLTHRVEQRTHHPTKIVLYDTSQDGRTILFVAESPHNRSADSDLEREGFAVTNQSIFSLLQGRLDGWTPWQHYQTFVSGPGAQPRRILEPDNSWMVPPELLRLSPDGRFAVMVRPAVAVPPDWDKYTDHLFKDIYLAGARRDPGGLNAVRQYFLLDLRHAKAQPLWSAPENPGGGVLWSPRGDRFAVGPTFLPTAVANERGLSGRAVVVVDASSRRFVELPLEGALPERALRPRRWSDANILEIGDAFESESAGEPRTFANSGGSWRPIEARPESKLLARPVQIELRQNPNLPPALYAVEAASGREKLLLDINPDLWTHVSLAHVELVRWKGTDGVAWSGMLYDPLHFERGKRYPLVIQTHGYSRNRFSLDGAFTTIFAAQPLANRDIAVLQMGGPDAIGESIAGTPREPEVFAAGLEGAIEHLANAGVADRGKVGMVGFSRTGWMVEYMLTHSHAPVAAAEVADNMDASYLQYVLSGAGTGSEVEADNGARPFGKGLETWLQMAPGFNTDRIHAPLRIELDTGPVSELVAMWEMYGNLRKLGKAVELSVIPDINHGRHILQNPRQRLASQGGTVDWFCYWLKDEEDSDPRKREQYARWRELRRQHERDTLAQEAAP
jgi:hypothetical protein